MKWFKKTYSGIAANPFLVSLVLVDLIDLLLIAAAANTAPTSNKLDTTPDVVMEVMDPALQGEPIVMWQKEIGRRFHNAVGIVVHGGEMVEGQWLVKASGLTSAPATPIQDLVKHYQKVHPGRQIVILACNPGHLKLGIPGVYYSPSNTWVIPDRFMTPEMANHPYASQIMGSRWDAYPDAVGNIFEFVKD